MSSDRYTLGPTAVRWIQEWLAVPGGDRFNKPFRLSRRQIRFVFEGFSYEEHDGKFVRVPPRAMYVGAKDGGKSPLCAAMLAFAVRGPSVPYDVDKDGHLVAREHPNALGQILANSENQSQRTTWRPLVSMLKNGKLKHDKHLEVLDTMIKYQDRLITYGALTLESVEGQGYVCAVVEESQYMRSQAKKDAVDAVQRACNKERGIMLLPTNAPQRGDGSYADQQIQLHEQGDNDELFLLYPQASVKLDDVRSKEAKPAVIVSLEEVYGESTDPSDGWVSAEAQYRNMLAMGELKGRRYYLNERTVSTGHMVDADMLAAWERKDVKIPAGQFVALGFDGSEAVDATALVAVSCTSPPHIQTLGIWRRPTGVEREGFKIPKAEVRATFQSSKDRLKVEAVIADPSISWKSYVDDLGDEYGEVSPRHIGDRTTAAGWGLVCQIWMNNSPKLTQMLVAHFIGLLDEWDPDDPEAQPAFTHDGDPVLVEHLLSLRRDTARNGSYETVTKESESMDDQIDGGVACMLGLWGAAQFPVRQDEATANPEDNTGGGVSIADRLAGRGSNGGGSAVQNRLLGR